MYIQKKLSGQSKYTSCFVLFTTIPTLSLLELFLMFDRILSNSPIYIYKADENFSSAFK